VPLRESMRGITLRREQGMADPVLASAGLTEEEYSCKF